MERIVGVSVGEVLPGEETFAVEFADYSYISPGKPGDWERALTVRSEVRARIIAFEKATEAMTGFERNALWLASH